MVINKVETLPLDDLLEKIVGGGTPSKKIKDYYEGDIPWATVKDMTGQYLDETVDYITQEAIENSSTNLIEKGQVIVATRMALGKAFINLVDMAINQDLKALYTKDNVDNQFLLYQLLSKARQIEALGSGTTVKGIRLEELRALPIELPTIGEQRKIAAILSSVDEAIEKTEQIIEQTETVKKGLMQQLFKKGIKHTNYIDSLVGKIPLSWEVVQLGELFKNKSKKKHEHLQVLTVTQLQGVIPRKDFNMNIKYDEKSLANYKQVNEGDFIISLRSFQGGLEVSHYEGIVSPAYTVLENKKKINKDFFKYFFKTFWFIEQLKSSTIGIRDGKQIPYKDFKLIKMPLPSLEEQAEIAAILERIDNRINFNKNVLQKQLTLKQGLMQQLLTGKVRVPIDDHEEVTT